MNRVLLFFGMPLVAVLALLVLATPGSAAVNGPCTGTINGHAIHGTVTVPENGTVAWEFISTGGVISSWSIQLESPFGSLPVDEGWDEDPDQTTKGGVASVNDYAKFSVGIYQLTGVVWTEGGPCTGSVEIVVKGNPLKTVIGAVGAGATVLGAAGAAISSAMAAKSTALAAMNP